MQIILIWLIKGYRYFLSPWIGMHCRFHPTCSCYAIEAIERFGAVKGSWLMITRLVRCHPFCDGGFDPVPDAPASEKTTSIELTQDIYKQDNLLSLKEIKRSKNH